MRLYMMLLSILCMAGCTVAPAAEEANSSQAVATAAVTATDADGEAVQTAESEADVSSVVTVQSPEPVEGDARLRQAQPTGGRERLPSVDMPGWTMLELDLVELDQTFLETIDQAESELGTPLIHRYLHNLTFADSKSDGVWQGEMLLYPEQSRLFLQKTKSGDTNAVEIRLIHRDGEEEPSRDTVLSMPLNLPTTQPADENLQYPEIQFVRARQTGETAEGTEWNFDVTLKYPDTGWEDYADGWHVETLDGRILGKRILLHPHVNEQPFTRGLSNVLVPADVSDVQVRSHALVSGYSEETVVVPLVTGSSGERYQVDSTDAP